VRPLRYARCVVTLTAHPPGVYLVRVEGVRGIPDRRPRYSLWITGRPRSHQAHGPATRYVAQIQAEATKQVQPPPLRNSTIDVEIIFAGRGSRPDVDNVSKLILDAMRGIVYDDDKQLRAVKVVGLRLDHGFRARGSPEVYKRLLSGSEFLVNIYDGGEVDVYLVDSKTPEHEQSSVVMLAIGRPVAETP
jgi:Holliday junction resolvase RusA-like endonuclease